MIDIQGKYNTAKSLYNNNGDYFVRVAYKYKNDGKYCLEKKECER